MKTFRIVLTLTIVGLLTITPTALGTEFCEYQSDKSGDWDSQDTWKCWEDAAGWTDCCDQEVFDPSICFCHVPQSGNEATILKTHTVTVKALQAIGKLHLNSEVTNPAKLEISSHANPGGSQLEINTGLFMSASPQPTRISFIGSAANPGRLVGKVDFLAAGDISVDGSAGGEITMDSGMTITLKPSGEITVPGGDLTIDGSIQQDGDVTVVAAHTVEFKGVGIGIGSTGTFTLDHASGKILINHGAEVSHTNVNGDFVIINGTLQVDKGFTFAGGLSWTGGAIIDCDVMLDTQQFVVTGNGS